MSNQSYLSLGDNRIREDFGFILKISLLDKLLSTGQAEL